MTSLAHTQDREPGSDSDALAGLLAAAARGDESAWRAIVERYGRRVFGLAKSRCRNVDVAEEITQSVFATVATKLAQGGYTEQGRFESWLFRVAMNRVRDEARRTKRHAAPADPAEVLDRLQGAALETGPATDRLDALRSAMGKLTASDREVIELRHHGGLSFKQIAELLEEPFGTLLARHHRALRKLKEMMGDAGEEPGEGTNE